MPTRTSTDVLADERDKEREKYLFAKYITKHKTNNKNSTVVGYLKRH